MIEGCRLWLEALADLGEAITVPDSPQFTAHGRRLLIALGVLESDPLRVEAEEWERAHRGAQTPATRMVRQELGLPVLPRVAT